jgi:hypothetical protein
MVLGYLKACPVQGLHYARALLPRRPITSDATALAVSNALKQIGWETEAQYILTARGTWWLKHPIPAIPSSALIDQGEQMNVSNHSGDGGRRRRERLHPFGTGGRVVKALKFFQLAGDVDRSRAILDRALWRCCEAVIVASQALAAAATAVNRDDNTGSTAATLSNIDSVLPLLPRGLTLHAYTPRAPYMRGRTPFSAFQDLNHYPEADFIFKLVEEKMRNSPTATREKKPSTATEQQHIAAESAMAVDREEGAEGKGDELSVSVALGRLLTAVSDADRLLGALSCPDTLRSDDVACLRAYVDVLSAIVHTSSSSSSLTADFNSANFGMTDVAEGEGNGYTTASSAEEMAETLRTSAGTIVQLIKTETVPMR